LVQISRRDVAHITSNIRPVIPAQAGIQKITDQAMKLRQYYVYILASAKNGTLYIGVTNDIVRRTDQHKQSDPGSFTNKYNVHTLVYFEAHDSIESAITREKNMKAWKRAWKVNLIEMENPAWRDLASDL
jgi:putative endonuclease